MTLVDRTAPAQSAALSFEFDLRHAPAKVWRALTARDDFVKALKMVAGAARSSSESPSPREKAMRIKWTRLYVDDQERALRFYTERLGFQKKADFTQGDYRWLTVVSSEEPEGVELLLESTANPAGKAYQAALRGQNQPAAQFLVDDAQAEYDRLAGEGVTFTTPVTSATGSVIAVLDDGCGNLIQLVQLTWG